MEITVQLTIQDLYRMLRHIKLGQNQFLDLVYRTFVLFFACIALTVANFSFSNPLWVVLLIPSAYYFFIYPKLVTLEAKKLFNTKDSFSQPIYYNLTEDGLETKSTAGEERIEWDRFTRMMASKHDYIFYLSRTTAFSIPKRIFDEAQDQEFQGLLGKYMHPNKIFRY